MRGQSYGPRGSVWCSPPTPSIVRSSVSCTGSCSSTSSRSGSTCSSRRRRWTPTRRRRRSCSRRWAVTSGRRSTRRRGSPQRIHPPLLEAGGLAVALRSAARERRHPGLRRCRSQHATRGDVAPTVYWCCLAALDRGRGRPARDGRRCGTRTDALDLRGRARRRARKPELGRPRDRVQALGGTLTISSEPGGGTRISGSLPLPR